jgi:hypothetical protein
MLFRLETEDRVDAVNVRDQVKVLTALVKSDYR